MTRKVAVIAICLLANSCTQEVNEDGLVPNVRGVSLSMDEMRMPEHALDGLEIAPTLEAMLFASEPMLVNPTNIAVDAKGRVWVNEGLNYRPHLNPQNPVREEHERIVILEDENGDGEADTRTVFYEGDDIDAALGIWVMGNRAIISASPNVILLTDEDGDDRADKKELLFTGIEGVQHDHAVHAFTFGPDGRFYFNYGNAGNQLLDKEGNPIIDMTGRPVVADGNPYRQGMVFRMNPDGSDFEVVGHNFRNNYEVAVDSYGTMWQSDNDDDGNRAVRINYVMEYGNYGFRDEMTGENWRARRTGMHEEIPKRHWHLNDPGVVPNLLQTGAGSPTGIVIYEGDLLPERFHGQMIHTDAGPNVVRAYPVEKDGAGYKAEIVNIMKGAHDPWFRPSDVTVAPDGSLIIADWYDPGVGGHNVGDLEKGRIFRIAPPGAGYDIPSYDYSTAVGAVEALKNPSPAVLYEAWMALEAMDAEAEEALLTLWNGDDQRFRARALWLLGRIESKGPKYVEEALTDENSDIRITGLRLARQLKLVLLPYLETLVNDPSPQVRREVALALRHNQSAGAASIWAALAAQYDGEDRWYLEALGIAADGQWDRFFAAWKQQNAEDWTSPAARNIVWRARSADAIPMLTSLILDPSTTEKQRHRYFRAFDFHTNQEAKSAQLPKLLAAEHPASLDISILALQHLAEDNLADQPGIREDLYRVLEQVEGSRAYLDLVDRFDLSDQNESLFAMSMENVDDELRVDAADLLIRLDGQSYYMDALQTGESGEITYVLDLLGRVGSGTARGILSDVFMDADIDLDTRKYALMKYGPGWSGENAINKMLEEGTFPEELKPVAASIMFSSNNEYRRGLAARYLDPPADLQGAPLPPLADMMEMEGSARAGQQTFSQLCSSCHVVDGEGIDFGPNLSEIGDKLPREALFNAILFPDAGVGFGYEGFLVTMNDGSAHTGYVLNRNDEGIQLREPGGVTRDYPLSEVSKVEALENSLMPSLARSMDAEQLVDLVMYLETLKVD